MCVCVDVGLWVPSSASLPKQLGEMAANRTASRAKKGRYCTQLLVATGACTRRSTGCVMVPRPRNPHQTQRERPKKRKTPRRPNPKSAFFTVAVATALNNCTSTTLQRTRAPLPAIQKPSIKRWIPVSPQAPHRIVRPRRHSSS